MYLLNKQPFSLKNFLFGKISRRISILFLLVGIVAPTIGIYYFYSISISLLTQNQEFFAEYSVLLETTALVIIVLIALDAGIIGFFISRSISKPIKQLHQATQELEKGNFNIKTNIKTNDEIEQLSHAFNNSAIALGKMEEERRQLDRAKSEFLSITSHELRTPITPLKAQIQMLQNEYFGKLKKKQKQSLKIVLKNVERLNKMIEDFLEISRIEAARLKFNFKKTNLKETIKETIGLMKGFAEEKNIKLVVKTNELPLIETDPDRVTQVLRNLIHNAIKFSKNNSKIEIHAVAKKDHILFSVKDYGAGMTPSDQMRIFEPFYQIEQTLDRKHGGTGLGLAICRGIVESQKGKIWVESEPGKGSIFNFTIPLKPIQEIEPIKVLFSPKKQIEDKVKEEFTLALGPIGLVEYNELKNKNAIGKDDLFKYIHSLEEQNILNNKNADRFMTNIGKIFGYEKKIEINHKIYEEFKK